MRKEQVGKISNKRGVQKRAEECLVNEKQQNGIQIDKNSVASITVYQQRGTEGADCSSICRIGSFLFFALYKGIKLHFATTASSDI